jgi:CDGSH-type Zn-finger protein
MRSFTLLVIVSMFAGTICGCGKSEKKLATPAQPPPALILRDRLRATGSLTVSDIEAAGGKFAHSKQVSPALQKRSYGFADGTHDLIIWVQTGTNDVKQAEVVSTYDAGSPVPQK